MKKILSLSLLLFGLTSVSTASAVTWGGGVNISATANPSMFAEFNVATNPRSGHTSSYFNTWVSTSGGSAVEFRGYDGLSGRSFFCQFLPTSSQYALAYEIAKNTGHGSQVAVYRNGNTCNSLSLKQDSRFQ